MKTFRGYVSRAQEGILAENPGGREFDTIPPLDEAKRRACHGTLMESLRSEDMGDEKDVPHGTDAPERGREEGCQDGFEPLVMNREGGRKHFSLRRLFGVRALVLALAANVLLVLAFALIMHVEKGHLPKVVFYIDLADRPAEEVAAPPGAEGLSDTEPAVSPAHADTDRQP